MIKKKSRKFTDYLLKNTELGSLYKNKVLYILGSWVRGLPKIRDIDLVVIKENRNEFWKIIENPNSKFNRLYEFKITSGNKDGKKLHGVLKNKNTGKSIGVDITIVNKKQLPFAKLFWVGNNNFGIAMKILAKAKGYKLTDTHLFSVDKSGQIHYNTDIKNESDIFKRLGYKFVPYKDREVNTIKDAISIIRRV